MRTQKNHRWVLAAGLLLSFTSSLGASAAQLTEEKTGEQRMSELSPQAALCSASSLRLMKNTDSPVTVEKQNSDSEQTRSRTAGRESADSNSAL